MRQTPTDSDSPEVARAALFTALRTGFARDLLQEAFAATRRLRARRRSERDLLPGQAAHGLGKLLVVAPDQVSARAYLAIEARGTGFAAFLWDFVDGAPIQGTARDRAGIATETRPDEWDTPETGRFCRLHDPEGNQIELWQPPK